MRFDAKPEDEHLQRMRKARSCVIGVSALTAIIFSTIAVLGCREYASARREYEAAKAKMVSTEAAMKEIAPLLTPSQKEKMLPKFKPAFSNVDKAEENMIRSKFATGTTIAFAVLLGGCTYFAFYSPFAAAVALFVFDLLLLVGNVWGAVSSNGITVPWSDVGIFVGITFLGCISLRFGFQWRAVKRLVHSGR